MNRTHVTPSAKTRLVVPVALKRRIGGDVTLLRRKALARMSVPSRAGAPRPGDASIGQLDVEREAVRCLAQRRPQDAIALLVTHYGNPLFRFCRSMLASDVDAQDVLQTVFMQAFEGLSAYTDRSTLGAWLFGIARHRCLDRIRSERRRGPAEPSPEVIAELPATGRSADEQLVARGASGAIEHCLDRLDAKLRAAVVLRYQQQLSYEEMSRLTGDAPGTLRVRVARALPLLRGCLEGKGVTL
jgi:RNA polymerase sigma-70 factor (ECF subfamily)